MEKLTKRVVDEFGSLISISGGTEEPADRTTPARFEQYEFVLEHGCFTASTDPDNDTLLLVEQRMTLPHIAPLTESKPWSAAVGSGVLWVWLLENHNGYQDGLQLEFGWSSGNFSVQLMCEASGLTAAAVLELDGQFFKA